MKRFLLIGLFAAAMFSLDVQAQDCEYIVGAKYNFNENALALLTPAKLDYYCRFSRNNFYVVNEVPQGATVYSISVVKNNKTQENLTTDFVVILDSLSYYLYNFSHYQSIKPGETVYFSTPNSEYPYLALRSYIDARNMTGEPDMSLDDPERNQNR